MSVTIHPELKMRARAAPEGVTVEAYLERLLRADQQAGDEIEILAIEGLTSGEPIEAGPHYWEEKHRRLDERLKKTGAR
jgi:hypothetical protein